MFKPRCGERGIILTPGRDHELRFEPFLPFVRILFIKIVCYIVFQRAMFKPRCGERGIILTPGRDHELRFEPFLPFVRILFIKIVCYIVFQRAMFKPRCGERGIRTLDTGSRGIHTFQACALDHSATSPYFQSPRIFRAEN